MKLLEPLLRRLGYARVKERPSKRNFAAAQGGRLTADWPTVGISLNSILSGQGQTLRARSKGLRDNEYFTKFLQMLVSNTIGDCGMTLKNKACKLPQFQDGKIVPGELDAMANTIVEGCWYEWGKKENCTIAKNQTWAQVQANAMREFGTCGETLWRMHFGASAMNDFGFALEHIAIDRLHTQSNYNLSNGNRVRMGVETTPGGRIVAYWITDTDPTDMLWNTGNTYSPRRYLAENFVRPFMMEEAEQTRGYPWAASSMLRMKMLQGYDEAALVGARAAACKMAFLTKTGTGVEYTGPEASGGGKYMEAEAGLVEELPQGVEVTPVDWHQPNSEYDAFTKACLRGIASGLRVSYPNLANDYESVNFSSGRMARLEEVEFWKFVQACIISDFHEPIFKNWLHYALLSSAIKIELANGKEIVLPASKEAKFCQPVFHGRRWQWLDPTKEIAAISEALNLKLTSWTRECATLGIDFEELCQEIAADKQIAEDHGITLPDEAELKEATLRLQAKEAQAAADAAENAPAPAMNGNGNGNGRMHLTGA